VNAALNGLSYTPTPNFVGQVTLSVATDDLGHTGAGGPQVDNDTVRITVNEANAPPVITSSGNVQVPENTTSVTTVTATDSDGDPVTFTISGGADQSAFAINSITGNLSFGTPKDFENPSDSNGDNLYLVQVTANDGHGGTDTQLIQVAVVDDAVEGNPTVTITGVTPNPRAGSVDAITIRFSEAVLGFDLSDLAMTRSASSTVNVPVGAATLTTSDNVTWRLGNLSTITAGSGIYELTLAASGSGIRNATAEPLLVGASTNWINGPGDSNEDRSFNQFDLIEVLQGGKYITGQPATWRQGDWNGDGVFNQVDIIAALRPNHYLQGSFAAMAAAIESSADDVAAAVVPDKTSVVAKEVTSTESVFEEVGQQEADSSESQLPADINPQYAVDPVALDFALAKDASDTDDDDELGLLF
jgi:hypothetical protein